MQDIDKDGGAVSGLSNPRYAPFICHFASQTHKFSQIVPLKEQNRQHFPKLCPKSGNQG